MYTCIPMRSGAAGGAMPRAAACSITCFRWQAFKPTSSPTPVGPPHTHLWPARALSPACQPRQRRYKSAHPCALCRQQRRPNAPISGSGCRWRGCCPWLQHHAQGTPAAGPAATPTASTTRGRQPTTHMAAQAARPRTARLTKGIHALKPIPDGPDADRVSYRLQRGKRRHC